MNNKFYQKIIYIISILAFLLFSYALMTNRVLPVKYRLYIFVGLLLVYLIFAFIIMKQSVSKLLKAITTVLLVLFAAVFLLGFRYIDKGVRTFNNISLGKKKMAYEFSLVVKKDSKLNSLDDIKDQEVIVAYDNDHKNINLFKNELEKKEDKELRYNSGDNYLSIAENLLKGKNEIILLNESYRSTILEKFDDFSKKTKVIYSMGLEKEDVNSLKAKEVNLNEPFNLYISGTDSYGEIDMVGRSDVNLLLSIDPKNRRILMTTIPRDSYLRIAGGGYDEYDKFTHSGIYGIDSSIQTLEQTFDTTINYYIKVNFSSLINMVDAMDHVDVVNLQGFKPVFSDEYFPRGILRVNGKQALHFARERKSLNEGDYERGRNHMRLLEAMIKRATSPSIILNYDKLLDVSVDSMDTNIPYNTIMDIINNQIEDDRDWTIIKEDLKGEGVLGLPSYAMPGYELWMFEPYEESIESISQNIKYLQDGKDPRQVKKELEEKERAESISDINDENDLQDDNINNQNDSMDIQNDNQNGNIDNQNDNIGTQDNQYDNLNNQSPNTGSNNPVREKTEKEIIKELKLVYPVPYNYQDINQDMDYEEEQWSESE